MTRAVWETDVVSTYWLSPEFWKKYSVCVGFQFFLGSFRKVPLYIYNIHNFFSFQDSIRNVSLIITIYLKAKWHLIVLHIMSELYLIKANFQMKQVASKSIWKSCNFWLWSGKVYVSLGLNVNESAQKQCRYKKLHIKLNFKGTLCNESFLFNKAYLYTVYSLLYSVMEHS